MGECRGYEHWSKMSLANLERQQKKLADTCIIKQQVGFHCSGMVLEEHGSSPNWDIQFIQCNMGGENREM
jgi:hypothetical protein